MKMVVYSISQLKQPVIQLKQPVNQRSDGWKHQPSFALLDPLVFLPFLDGRASAVDEKY